MNWHAILGITATISLFLPAAVILYNRLFENRSLAALLASYLFSGFYNLMSTKLLIAPSSLVYSFGLLSNFLDIPLILFSLLFFCPIKQKQKPVHFVLGLFLAYEVVVACVFGLRTEAVVYIMGAGIPVVLLYTFYLFAKQIKVTVEYRKNTGRAVMLASILFAYSCYGIVYYFYYVQKTPNASDVYLVYYIATFVSALVMATGLYMVRKRMHELREVKNMRRELTVFFNS